MEPLIPTLTLEQLKQNAKFINRYLKKLNIDLSHSTALDVSSNGFGYADYNTAKALLELKEAEEKTSMANLYNPEEDEDFLCKAGHCDIYALTKKEFIRHYLTLGYSMEYSTQIGAWHYDFCGGAVIDAMLDPDFLDARFQGLTETTKMQAHKIQIIGYFIMLMCDMPYGTDGFDLFIDTNEWFDLYGVELLNTEAYMTEHVAAVLGMEYQEGMEIMQREIGRYKELVKTKNRA